MIISVNGREKKIAILDNGKVTEFYIERGEENSGVVGNIYKGRVQRVLPGMQSAFVEIGLERDAFLYVSDFFDEEEEIERIVMEKSKKTSPEEAKKEADDRIERARLEREKQMEAVQEIAEPLAETNLEKISGEDKTPSVEIEARSEQQQQGQSRRDRRRGKKGRTDERETAPAAEETEEFVELSPEEQEFGERISDEDFEETEVFAEAEKEEYAPVFTIEDSGFERIVDIDDEETTGEMFKDAYMQEAIVDKVRAIEFDMESASGTEVGSLIGSVGEAANGFERIADEDEEQVQAVQQEEPEKGKRRSRGGKGRGKKSEEQAAETEIVAALAQETEAAETGESSGKSKGKGRGRSGKGKKSAEAAAETTETAETVSVETEAAPEKSSRNRAGGKKSSRKAKKEVEAEALEDAQASVRETGDIADMAVRRGGRGGRNRRGGRGRRAPGGEETTENGEQSFDETESISGDFEAVEREAQPSTGGDRNQQDNRGGKNFQGGNGGGRDRGGRDSRDKRSQPTITDLLREGQEILVQIAKEPIARKGARITSHIALPGRFLVYMPTIEHLGVSRKIESSNERGRLRTLIQKIRQSEDIPSGGFIVRTAGIGISEEDLRQDARYLVRTWLDIKKTSEKAKSPALVHQDLDIIQRILRDQLSDDFAAIRVDSEEEYLRIVEFINRIQPRMVNRVKLYTREDPILEAYGVQEEVDKALKPRVWLKSGGYLVINQTEALVAIDVNTGKFVGKGNARLEDTITKTNMEAVEEIARQIRLRDLGGIIVLDLIDMEDRRNRQKVSQALQEALASDKSPTKVLSFNDFGLIIMTRKRVKQSLERTMCAPCEYCQSAGWVKSPQTVCYEILSEARRLSKTVEDVRHTTLRVHPEVAKALRTAEKTVLEEIEAYLGSVDLTGDKAIHQEQFDFAFI